MITCFSFLGLICLDGILNHSSNQIVDSNNIIVSTDEWLPKTTTETIATGEIASSYISESYVDYAVYDAAPAGSYMSIGSRTLNIFDTDDTRVDAGNSVGRYGSRFFYCHDTAAFSELAYLPIGTEFSVTIDGNTTNYRIVDEVVLTWNETARFMNAIANASYRNIHADISLMTCSGSYDYNLGTKDHRLVVFANQI